MDDQNKNLILATVLSFLVILGWYTFFPPPEPAPQVEPTVTETAATGDTALAPIASGDATSAAQPEEVEAPQAPRVSIDTPRVSGSISLQGGRIDDLALKDYRVTLKMMQKSSKCCHQWVKKTPTTPCMDGHPVLV